jgi:hypothetical protein
MKAKGTVGAPTCFYYDIFILEKDNNFRFLDISKIYGFGIAGNI